MNKFIRKIGTLKVVLASIFVSYPAHSYYQASSINNSNLNATVSSNLRFCENGEAPVSVANGARNQICRYKNKTYYGNLGFILGPVPNPVLSNDVVRAGKFCEEQYNDIGIYASVMCKKPSSLGYGPASRILGDSAVLQEEQRLKMLGRNSENFKVPDEAMAYYFLGSNQGDIYSSFMAGTGFLKNGETNKSINHFYRCFQSSVNERLINSQPEPPLSYVHNVCTLTIKYLIMSGQIDQGPFYDKVAIEAPQITSESPRSNRILKDQVKYNWTPYSDMDLNNFKFNGLVNYKIWMIQDRPFTCYLTNKDGNTFDDLTAAKICKNFMLNFTFKSAKSIEGHDISGILEGSRNIVI